MKANVVGDLLGDNLIVYQKLINDTAAHTYGPFSLANVDGLCFQLINEANGGSNLTGTWKIEVSNNYADHTFPNPSQTAQVGQAKWTDITSQFSPSITNPSGSPLSQYVQAYPLVAGWIRVGFTAASGSGLLTITYFAKGTR